MRAAVGMNPSDQGSGGDLRGRAAQVLAERSDEILKTWVQRVRETVHLADKLSQPILVDTLPLFIGNLAQALATNHPRGLATESNNVAQEHGGERARVTQYGPRQIIQEYQILKVVVEETLQATVGIGDETARVIQMSFDQAVQDAMTAYFLVHSRVREQFVATLTHDLRTPLGVVGWSAQLMLRQLAKPIDAESQARLQTLATTIVKQTRRGDQLIQDLLDTTLLHAGERLRLSIVACELYAVAREVGEEIGGGRVTVVGEEAAGHWDRGLLVRALENLVSNALKYGAEDGVVTVKVAAKLGRVMLSVHNVGNPIPIDEQELLFQAFRRSRSAKAGNREGWGLGLALVRGVAEAHGGSLGVDSSPAGGTTFTLDIPEDARPFAGQPP